MEPITHSIKSDHPEWNESYYLAFFNKEFNIGGVSRIGFKPNKQEGMSFFFSLLARWFSGSISSRGKNLRLFKITSSREYFSYLSKGWNMEL